MYPSIQAIFDSSRTSTMRAAHDEAIPVITAGRNRFDIREVQAEDTNLVARLFANLSQHTSYLRFFRTLPREQVCAEALRVTGGDPATHAAIVAVAKHKNRERAVALAQLVHDADDSSSAEFAIVIHDNFQREGLGRSVLSLLFELARLRGVTTLHGTALEENWGVRQLIRAMDLPLHVRTSYGETTFRIKLVA